MMNYHLMFDIVMKRNSLLYEVLRRLRMSLFIYDNKAVIAQVQNFAIFKNVNFSKSAYLIRNYGFLAHKIITLHYP